MNKRWIRTRNFKDGNTNPMLNDYEYDANDFRVKKIENLFCEESERSSMVKDRNKGITEIKYNHLNLPSRITWANNKYISYQYNAAGQKVRKTVDNNDSLKIVDYLDGFQTEGRGSRTPKKRRSHKTRNSEQNHTATLVNFDLKILNFQNLICPFGLKHKAYANIGLKMIETINNETEKALVNIGLVENDVTATLYKYKYNGKKLQDELGLDWYDYGARNYDPALGRWMNIDPLAEQYAYNSTYAFQENKMGMGRELEGLELVEWAKDKAQKIKETVNETVEQGKEWVKNNVVIEAEAKVTVGGQAGLKTGFGKVEAGFATTELGKVGVSTEKGTYAVKGDGKGHNFVGANVKALDKKLSVGAKVDYVTNDVAPPDGSDLVEYYPIQWGVNLGPEGSIGPGVKGDYDFLSTDTNIGTNSDCKCIDLGVGIKAVFGVDVNVRIGIKR